MKTKAVILEMTSRLTERKDQEEFFKLELSIFRENGIDVDVVPSKGKDDAFYIDVLKDADIAFCFGHPRINRKVIENTPRLKVVQRPGIGIDTIDLEAATEYGKIVNNVTGYCLEELAAHATALILANMRNVTFYDRTIREGQWLNGRGRMPRRMSTLTAGLFGFGGSGFYTARIMGQGFGCRVIAYDPYASAEHAAKSGVRLVDFDTLLTESDIISIHAPLTPETKHIFNAEAFGKMKKNAIIANTSRGPIIEEAALADALREGKITAAGLDVFEDEPLAASSPLLAMKDNTVLTPHSAFQGKEATEIGGYMGATIASHFFSRKTIYTQYLRNPEVLEKFSAYTINDAAIPVPKEP